MKKLLTVLVMLVSITTFAQKKTEPLQTKEISSDQVRVSPEATIPDTGTSIMGKVVSNKMCPAYIVATIDGKSVNLYPTNLGADFAVDGVSINFDYKVVNNVLLPEGCDLKAAVEISNVKKIKVRG